jgi:hypothetical protein
MRRGVLLLLLAASVTAGPASAQAGGQAAVAPVTSLEGSLDSLRVQTAALAQLLVGARLRTPSDLHDLAGILDDLSVSLHRLATHAEHGQVTAAQRAALEAEITRSRLMLDQLGERIRALQSP